MFQHLEQVVSHTLNLFYNLFQEAATSTQSVSADDSSSGDEKMMITLQSEADQSELTIVDPLESNISNEGELAIGP